jgi:putative transposase
MPWLETSPVDQRERFIADHRRGFYTMTELCERYGISRKSGYKWLDRFEAEGRAGLRDRSRAPHRCPHRISAEVARLICAARRAHPAWGPEKLLDWLEPRHRGIPWPAVSTAGDLLARRGLVKKRRRRRPHQHPGVVPPTTHAPNDLWTADFKGHFRTRDGIYCYPLTIADQHTRHLLTCQGLRSTKGQGDGKPTFRLDNPSAATYALHLSSTTMTLMTVVPMFSAQWVVGSRNKTSPAFTSSSVTLPSAL